MTGPAAASGTRRAVVQPVAIGVLVVVTFVGTYLLLLLAPAPQDLRLAVVGTPAAPAAWQDRLPAAGIALVPVPDAAAAELAVLDRSAAGAYLPGDRVLITAGAAGAASAQALARVIPSITGSPVQIRDVAPLPEADPRGLAGFYLVFGMVLAGFIFGQTNHVYSRVLPLRWRLAQTAVVAPVAGLVGAVIAGPVVGASTAPVAVLAAVLTLLVAAVALATQAATSMLGDPGILLATLLLLTLGNAVSGGAIPIPFLPDGLRQLAPLLPPGAAVNAIQDAGAFPLADPIGPYVVLVAWIAGAALIMVAAYRRTPGDGPLRNRVLAG